MNELGSGDPAALDVSEDVTWLGVHTLTEFMFCARAGLLSFETQREDDGEEEPFLRLDYVPQYDAAEIEREISGVTKRLPALAAVPGVVAVVGAVIMSTGIHWIVPALAVVLVLSVPLVRAFKVLSQLLAARRAVLNARPKEPDPDTLEDQPANWWAMLKSGFDSCRYEPLTVEQWRLSGRPWRVLRRGDLRIPVFRKRRVDGARGHELFSQHYARIAAYGMLLGAAEGAKSPYGLVLFGDGYEGIAVSTRSPKARAALERGLGDARRAVRDIERSGLLPAAPGQSHCAGCPWGRPRVYRSGVTDTLRRGVPLPVVGTTGADGRTYHSSCGDRFQWVPPHELAEKRGLVSPG